MAISDYIPAGRYVLIPAPIAEGHAFPTKVNMVFSYNRATFGSTFKPPTFKSWVEKKFGWARNDEAYARPNESSTKHSS